jgi:hypothetical protein
MDKTAGDKDQGYTVEAAIPWASFTKAPKHPPAPFDTWHVNFYAMKQNAGVAWSPILGQGNFHKASRFGTITWTVPGMAPPAAAPAAPEPVAAAPGSAAPAMPPPGALPEGRPFRPPFHPGMRPRMPNAAPPAPPP